MISDYYNPNVEIGYREQPSILKKKQFIKNHLGRIIEKDSKIKFLKKHKVPFFFFIWKDFCLNQNYEEVSLTKKDLFYFWLSYEVYNLSKELADLEYRIRFQFLKEKIEDLIEEHKAFCKRYNFKRRTQISTKRVGSSKNPDFKLFEKIIQKASISKYFDFEEGKLTKGTGRTSVLDILDKFFVRYLCANSNEDCKKRLELAYPNFNKDFFYFFSNLNLEKAFPVLFQYFKIPSFKFITNEKYYADDINKYLLKIYQRLQSPETSGKGFYKNLTRIGKPIYELKCLNHIFVKRKHLKRLKITEENLKGLTGEGNLKSEYLICKVDFTSAFARKIKPKQKT